MKKTESGRSMVEMLGVLAIIGVLSIGGIMGYTMAMNRNYANKLLDGAAKLSVLGMARGHADSSWNSAADVMTAAETNIDLPSGVTMQVNHTGAVEITAGLNDAINAIITATGANMTGNVITFNNN